MPFLMRVIRTGRWLEAANTKWQAIDDIPADPLGDLSTQENKLSVWVIDEERANFARVVAAVAATRDRIVNLDYALLKSHVLHDLGFGVIHMEGKTSDKHVNAEWHRDIVNLSAQDLIVLAKSILADALRERISHKRIEQFITSAIGADYLNQTLLPPKLREKLTAQGLLS